MARFGLWLAVLGLCCITALVNADVPTDPVPDSNDVCKRFSRDGSSLGMAEVFDMIMIQYRDRLQNMNTELLRDYMIYDVNHDNRFNMEECDKLVEKLETIEKLK